MQRTGSYPAAFRLWICLQVLYTGTAVRHIRILRLRQLFGQQLRRLRFILRETSMTNRKNRITIGTRGSQLALWQANWVKSEVERQFPDTAVEIHIIKTTGDRIVDRPLAMVGGKGLFVKEIEKALLDARVDLAVHSMKDMPGDLPDGLCIGAVPLRENPFDVVVSRDGTALENLKPGALIGTSSLRRASQLKAYRPDLKTDSIRGNLDTRIKKLNNKDFDALILAAAGMKRLGMNQLICQYLDESIMVPAAGQGALCIESRTGDPLLAPILERLNHDPSHCCVSGERSFLKRLGGSCHIPAACYGRFINDKQISLTGLVASEDGTSIIRETIVSGTGDIQNNGTRLADLLLGRGAGTLLESIETHDRE